MFQRIYATVTDRVAHEEEIRDVLFPIAFAALPDVSGAAARVPLAVEAADD